MSCHMTTATWLLPSRRVEAGLRLAAKRYIPEYGHTDGVTLLFFHCAGSHKEVWEPTIEYLFSAASSKLSAFSMREAWSFDMQNHGEGAVLNDAALETIGSSLTVEDWAEGVKRLLSSEDIFAGLKFVGVGHSLGATALLLSTIADDVPAIKYEGIVLVESSLLPREVYEAHREERDGLLQDLCAVISRRRDAWNSRTEALTSFEKRHPWLTWDACVLQIFVHHGLRDIGPSSDGEGEVVLCCRREQESSTYLHTQPHFVAAEIVRNLPPSYPLYFVVGDRLDFVPEHVRDALMNTKQDVSVHKVVNAGHFVVQENPRGLALALAQILTRMHILTRNSRLGSRL
ncbi:alpha/beta-hydrolase [Trametes coccinea BRFM310]|uniref:Alpha/beta-hydrolase n=1 Tax=Trametes coccinea (strain BRFM310) TaxID=1353009 RepID=A0A1Y2ICU7_TRAC3|nr:alpha/beta-hydrolase [Trametes coccinea BRFM310]